MKQKKREGIRYQAAIITLPIAVEVKKLAIDFGIILITL